MKLINILSLLMGTCISAHAADRTLEHEAIIAAPVADVWDAFTTSEGFKSWAVVHAEIDLRIGGDMRTSYVAESDLHDEHTIVNRILSFEPQRMLSIQNAQAPAAFENAELFQQTWSVIYFEPLSGALTRVRVVGMGYGEGPAWDDIYSKFNAGNAYTLKRLQEKFADLSVADDKRVLELLHKLAGGEWIHEAAAPDGPKFRVRNVIEVGPDGESLVSRSWLGDDEGMFQHGATLVWSAPQTDGGGIWFRGVNEQGAVSSGRITLADADTIHWDWNARARTGETTRYGITQRLVDQDHYHMTIVRLASDARPEQREMVSITFERVAEAPARFKTPRSSPPHQSATESTETAD